MSRILIIAESGFGKTTAYVGSELHGIKGLNPKDTYVITVTSKPLAGRGSNIKFPVYPSFNDKCTAQSMGQYRRIISNDAAVIAHAIRELGKTPIQNIVLDDSNYIMQDYYMAKALSSGWDAPKKIGADMGKIFAAIEMLPYTKNFIMIAHGEEYDKADGRKGYRMKTTGKMVQEYITPEGKFDVVLIGRSYYNDTEKKAIKEFVTNDDGTYSSAKSHEIFDSLYIPNDLGYVVDKCNEYYNTPEPTFEEEIPEETHTEIQTNG